MVSRDVIMLGWFRWIGRTVRSGSNGLSVLSVPSDRIGLGVTRSFSTITHDNSGGAEPPSAPPLYAAEKALWRATLLGSGSWPGTGSSLEGQLHDMQASIAAPEDDHWPIRLASR